MDQIYDIAKKVNYLPNYDCFIKNNSVILLSEFVFVRFYLYLKEVKKFMIFMQYIICEIPQIFSFNFSIYYYFEIFYAKHSNS